MNGVYGYLAALLATLGGALLLYVKGRRAGKKVEHEKQTERDLAAEQQRNIEVRKAMDIDAHSRSMDSATVERQLRDKYTRPKD